MTLVLRCATGSGTGTGTGTSTAKRERERESERERERLPFARCLALYSPQAQKAPADLSPPLFSHSRPADSCNMLPRGERVSLGALRESTQMSGRREMARRIASHLREHGFVTLSASELDSADGDGDGDADAVSDRGSHRDGGSNGGGGCSSAGVLARCESAAAAFFGSPESQARAVRSLVS